mgnify:CR=1 FL=1
MNRMQAAEQMRKALQLYVAALSEDDALMVATVYPEWAVNVKYKNKEWVKYGENAMGDPVLYQVLQDHTSQAQYTPDTATSLYKKVGEAADGTPKWVQPCGATDAYNKGDIVDYNGVKYISTIDANVWAPDVYGWEVYDGESSTDPVEPSEPDTPTDDIKDFVQPTGSHDAYAKGDKVRFEGKVYESLIDNNVYSPAAYPAGWKEISE